MKIGYPSSSLAQIKQDDYEPDRDNDLGRSVESESHGKEPLSDRLWNTLQGALKSKTFYYF